MATPILRTKVSIPPARPNLVPRRRLIECLEDGLHRKLTLVSAPAGFGKTTLVRHWIGHQAHPAAWLSLDPGDHDLSRFLVYLIAALQEVVPSLEARLGSLLGQSQAPSTETILTALVNELNDHDARIVLVLDDYHLVDSPPVDDAMGFLLDHLPPSLHLVITTREDPRLPLSRLRARGQMTELRAADLRFTADEAALFLRNVMGIDLSAHDVATLESRTEGWIAGLQLAALSMQGRDDISGFIEAFAGDNRYIVDYLIDEVLARQTDDVRNVLLQTSILARLSGPLCDAVTGRSDSTRMLESLARSNLFVVPLDDTRQWYRYHHLFGDALRVRLAEEFPDLVPVLHARSSAWFERHGDLSAAIHHAFGARDHERAADLVERSVPAMARARQEVTLLAWMRALPDEAVRARPVLCVHVAGVLMQALGDAESAEVRLRDAERWLEPAASRDGMVVADQREFGRLPGQIAIYRAGQALIRGDVDGTITHARLALDLLPEGDDFGRGAASGLLGLAFWTRGDLDEGHRMYTECMARLQRAGFISDLFGCALVLADIRITQGRLHDALATYEQALARPEVGAAPPLRGTADMHVGISGIHRERNDLEAAGDHLRASKNLGEHIGLRQNPYRWQVAMARVLEARGDIDGAFDMLTEAGRLYEGDFSPNVRPVPAMTARLRLVQGRVGEALSWVRQRDLSTADVLSYLHEYEHITLARILLARYRDDRQVHAIGELTAFLARLLSAAEEGGRTGSAIEILILQALAQEAHGDVPGALDVLEGALTLAEPEGYVRMFVDEGAPMQHLLTECARRDIMPGYTETLLAAFAPDPTTWSDAAAQSFPDLLSEREMEVLRLIADGLSNQEIADRLYLALDTVKGHNRRLFAKLDVQRRTEAISRARELGLL